MNVFQVSTVIMKSITQSFTVRVQQIILKLIGLITDPKYTWYPKLYLVFYFGLVFPSNIAAEFIALCTLKSFIYRIDAIVYLALTCLLPAELIGFHRRRHVFQEIYETIKSNDEYIDEQFYKQCDQRLQKSFFNTAMLTLGLLMMTILYPLLLTICTDVDYGSPPTLIYPCTFPWKVDGTLSYVFAITAEILASLFPISVIIGVTLYILYIKIVLESFNDVMERKIRKMGVLGKQCLQHRELAGSLPIVGSNKTASRDLSTRLESDYNEKMLKELHGIFRYHQFLIKYDKPSIKFIILDKELNKVTEGNFCLAHGLTFSFLCLGQLKILVFY